jgi:toxin-antitoxin system PIN domain toxin
VSRVALLDVNLLVALFDADHTHHELAHDWFADNRSYGWATCPVTENGLIRVLANPQYGSPVSAIPAVLDRLKKFRANGHHEFWADALSLTDATLFASSLVRGYRQVTDVYLLGLAHSRGGRLATFDRSISLGSVPGATRETLEMIAPLANPAADLTSIHSR